MTEENCPTCGKQLHPPLKSGRQVCSVCGWSDKKKRVSIETSPSQPHSEVFQSIHPPENTSNISSIEDSSISKTNQAIVHNSEKNAYTILFIFFAIILTPYFLQSIFTGFSRPTQKDRCAEIEQSARRRIDSGENMFRDKEFRDEMIEYGGDCKQ